MPVLDFLNDNQFQNYPFQLANNNYADEWVVDCNLVVGPKSSWSYDTDSFELYSIADGGATWIFKARSSNHDIYFRFAVSKTAGFGTTIFASASATDGGSTNDSIGFGFMQFGDLTSVAVVALSARLLNPTAIQNLANQFVTTISIANQYTTRYSDVDCDIGDSTSASGDYKVEQTGLVGDVYLEGGRFCISTLLSSRNQIDFAVASNPVLGGVMPCETLRVLPDDYDDSLEPLCNELTYTINGVSPDPATKILQFQGSIGITIKKDDTNDHQLNIKVYPSLLFAPDETIPDCSDSV